MKKILKRILELFFIFIFIITSFTTTYLIKQYNKSNKLEVTTLVKNKTSNILDKDGNIILKMEITKENNVKFNELPDVFINALISAEDARFFIHQGIDLQRIISSLITNVSKGKLQGAST